MRFKIKKVVRYMMKLVRIYRFEVLRELIERNNYESFAEIGVFEGDTSRYILRKCKSLKKVYCIDNYINNNHLRTKQEMVEAKRKIKDLRQNPKVIFIDDDSEAASKLIKDNSVDIVFIDADHSYESTKKDIELWYPKIRRGGVLAGHDFNLKWLGLVKAVTEKFKKIHLTDDNVWWVKKDL